VKLVKQSDRRCRERSKLVKFDAGKLENAPKRVGYA
jgi:hypothetical protein